MDPTKVKGVADWPPPRNPTDIRSFLGFTGFYRYFIPNYSRVARPLLDLTKKATPLGMDGRPNKGVRNTKVAHVFETRANSTPIRQPFVVHTDASAYGVGTILLQAGEINPKTP